jgi:signal peptidase I
VSVTTEDPPAAPAPPAKSGHSRRQLIEWGIVIVLAFLTATILRATTIQAFSIPSVSMENTLLVGDRVLVNKQNRDANVGDIVVFHRPPGEEAAKIKDLIKRVVAVQGQTVSAQDGKLFVDNKALDEPYLKPGVTTLMDEPVTIRCDCVFVMGDNRAESRDSRFFGPIKKSSIIGHAFFRVWPLGRFGSI